MTRFSLPEDLPRVLSRLAEERRCYHPVRYTESVYLTEPVGTGWGNLARLLSLSLGGQVWQGSSGVAWQYGRRTLYVRAPGSVPACEAAQRIVQALTGEAHPPSSVSACTRALLSWLEIAQPRWYESVQLVPFRNGKKTVVYQGKRYVTLAPDAPVESFWNYQCCASGTYPEGAYYDISSCYHSIYSRCPTPIVNLIKGEVVFSPLPLAQERRWRRLVEALGAHKGLRNQLIGCAYAQGGGTFWVGGTPREGKLRSGILRPLAALVVRTTWELTHRAVRERGLYAKTDCVIKRQRSPPAVWEQYGIKSKCEAYGEIDLHAVDDYRVGVRSTRWYDKRKQRERETGARSAPRPIPPRGEPERLYLPWLDSYR